MDIVRDVFKILHVCANEHGTQCHEITMLQVVDLTNRTINEYVKFNRV